MGVGFAVARFGFFLREMRASELHLQVRGSGVSVYAGVALVVLGVGILVSGVVQHIRTVRELRSGTWVPGRVTVPAITLGTLLAVVGIGMAVYLLLLR